MILSSSSMSAQGGRRQSDRARRGAATAEFALLAALIIAPSLIAMFELSRGIMVREVLSNSARKGCRTGILPSRSNSEITADVTNILSDNSIDSTSATITIKVNDVVMDGTVLDAKTAVATDKVSVQVSIPLAKVYWMTRIFLNATNIQSETFVMMRQG